MCRGARCHCCLKGLLRLLGRTLLQSIGIVHLGALIRPLTLKLSEEPRAQKPDRRLHFVIGQLAPMLHNNALLVIAAELRLAKQDVRTKLLKRDALGQELLKVNVVPGQVRIMGLIAALNSSKDCLFKLLILFFQNCLTPGPAQSLHDQLNA